MKPSTLAVSAKTLNVNGGMPVRKNIAAGYRTRMKNDLFMSSSPKILATINRGACIRELVRCRGSMSLLRPYSFLLRCLVRASRLELKYLFPLVLKRELQSIVVYVEAV